MAIAIEDIKHLREQTGGGIIECKKALEDCDGNIEKATELLKKQGVAKAEKKADRVTTAGLIETYVHAGGKVGAMVELLCETDFVARTDDYKNLSHELCLQIAAMDPGSVDNLLEQVYIRDGKTLIKDLIKGIIAKVGENIKIGRIYRVELGN